MPYFAEHMDIEKLKRMLGLKPLPDEGGFYAETYRSEEKLAAGSLPGRYGGERRFGTAIYFLLTRETFSALHKLASDEVYHFYLGDPVELLCLREDGSGEVVTMGTDLNAGMRPQITVPRGAWQGSRVRPGGEFALLGTTMAPGFEFADFELANRALLLERYPKFSEMIRELTRSSR
jgi:predicted cupin superfamily sugar epimerase